MAAVNRAQAVIRTYQDSPAVEEALAQMVLGYDKLGLTQLRDDTRRVLERTAPNSPYLVHGYNPSLVTGLAEVHRQNRPSGIWSRLAFWN
jgi:outer membrane protein assembly factor BamD